MRAIFLDLDDTILDFHRAERQALSRTLEHFRVAPAPAVLDRYHELNRRQWELLEEGKLTRPQVLVRRFQLLFDELGVRADPEAVCQRYEEQLAQGRRAAWRRISHGQAGTFRLRGGDILADRVDVPQGRKNPGP